MRTVETRREGLGLMQSRQAPPIAARWHDRRPQGEAEVNGLLTCLTRLRQMRQGTEGLLNVRHGRAVCRPCQGLLPRLPAVHQGLGPPLTSEGKVGQAFDLLGYPIPGERLKGLDYPGV